METDLIFEGKATLDDLYLLNGLGYEFVVEGGKITWMGKQKKEVKK